VKGFGFRFSGFGFQDQGSGFRVGHIHWTPVQTPSSRV